MTKIFSSLMKTINLQIQNTTKNYTARHIIIKELKTRIKDILKRAGRGEWRHITYRKTKIKIMPNFL